MNRLILLALAAVVVALDLWNGALAPLELPAVLAVVAQLALGAGCTVALSYASFFNPNTDA